MPLLDVDDTIAAIASAAGPALRGIIRISGPTCQSCLQSCFRLAQPSQDLETKLNTASVPAVLDVRLCLDDQTELPGQLLFWKTERSYTRQPSAEFHTFGSPPLLNLALSKICQSGARLAIPGEFTLRAFLSGRIDLTQAEAVLATIDSQDQPRLQRALKQLAGGSSGPLTEARDQLVFVLAELEAGLDFVEEDIEFISREDLIARLQQARGAIGEVTRQIQSRDRQIETFRVALLGLPNAGKSSLFNSIVGFDRAIVTEIAGTTTDFLTATVTLHGIRFEFVDTAGLEETGQSLSVADRAQAQTEFANATALIRLLCINASRPVSQSEQTQLQKIGNNTIIVRTKSDLPVARKNLRLIHQLREEWGADRYLETSANSKIGVQRLLDTVFESAVGLVDADGDVVGSTVVRAADSLRMAENSVILALQAARENAGDEIVAAEIRQALEELGRVVGTVYTDDILDVVFSRFCIGK